MLKRRRPPQNLPPSRTPDGTPILTLSLADPATQPLRIQVQLEEATGDEGNMRKQRRMEAVLDTGAGVNLIRKEEVPKGIAMKKLSSAPLFRDANNNMVKVTGLVFLNVSFNSGQSLSTRFLVVETLSVPLLLGVEFIQEHVKSIQIKQRTVTMMDGNDVPLVPSVRRKLEDRDGAPVWIDEAYVVPPMSEVVVEVSTSLAGLVVVSPELSRKLRRAHLYVSNSLVVVDATRMKAKLKIANFSKKKSRILSPGQIVGRCRRPHEILSIDSTELKTESEKQSDWQNNIDLDHLSEKQKEEVLNMLDRYKEMWSGKLGVLKGTTHRIPTTGGPVFQAAYRAGPQARQRERDEVERMLEMKVIEPSSAEWANPVVLVRKPDGSTRFCVDYRKLNAITTRDVYPLPRMEECIDSLGDATIFSTLDANSGYWQVEIAEEDRDKTTFTCHVGLYRFIRMPFGLSNAPATFQRAMDIILSGVKWDICLVYLDDIIVYSPSYEQHLIDLERVVSLLHGAGATLNLKKCRFFQSEVKYLGHLIRAPGELAITSDNIRHLAESKPPCNKKELRSFLGLANVYRRFVPKFAAIAAPLTEKLKKEAAECFELNTDELKSFHTLISKLVSPPVLALPRKDHAYVLDVDASDLQLGCCLQQKDDEGRLHPIGYWSRTLNPPEKNYSTTEKECLAVVWAVTHLKAYLQMESFVIRTDHESLKWLLAVDGENSRLCRWRLRLAEYDFTVVYRPGIKNQPADAMSRLQTTGDTSTLDDEVPVLIVRRELPSQYGPTLVEPDGGPPITLDDILKAQDEEKHELESLPHVYVDESDGLICRKSVLDGRRQIVVPKKLREHVLALAHLPRLAAHPGSSRMYQNLRRQFYWPSLAFDVRKFVETCPSCAKQKLRPSKHRTTFMKLFPPKRAMEFVGIDLLGPLPVTEDGNRYLLIITDRFSKLTRAIPLKKETANDVAEAFFDHWVAVYGIPLILLSDNGSQFRARHFQSLCSILGTKQLFTAAYHPSTNGQTERFNRTILESMTHYVAEHQRDWDKAASSATFAYNTTVNTSTGFSPFELVLGNPPRSISTPRYEFLTPHPQDKAQYREEFLRRVEAATIQAREKIAQAQARYKEVYDRYVRVRNEKIAVGDLVFIRTFVLDPSKSPKLHFPAAGPFVVTNISTDRKVYWVQSNNGEMTVSSDRVVRAAPPEELPAGMEYVNPTGARDSVAEELDVEAEEDVHEYVIERVIGHREIDGRIEMRVRWHGFTINEDTWEPVANLPAHFVKSYQFKKKLGPNFQPLRR